MPQLALSFFLKNFWKKLDNQRETSYIDKCARERKHRPRATEPRKIKSLKASKRSKVPRQNY
ncbi:hypothetical protein, partial [Limnofasciculus baicalensis]